MCAVRVSVFRISLLIAILFSPGCIYGQLTRIDSILALVQIDTSDYIPSFYKSALDYNLMIAASKGFSTEIERLIAKGADVDCETNERATPMVFAVTNDRLGAVKTLLKYYPQLNSITSSYESPLLIAVKHRNFEICEALIRAGADVDLLDRHGATPLHHAALNGYLEIVDMLLYYGATIDEKSIEGTTPLLASIWAGNTDVSDLLIQDGADIEAKDNEGFTPFLLASFYGDTILMDMLYKKGADIYTRNNANHNALTLSILTGQKNITLYLLRLGNKWSDPRNTGINPFSVAAKYRRKDIADILSKNYIPGHLKHEIDQIAFNASSRFFFGDFYSGFRLSFKEPMINGGFIAGCDTKLWYTKVLIKETAHQFYQYYDKGSVAYAGLFKDFNLTDRPDRTNYSISTLLLAGYSFGNRLKGTMITPENKFKIIPSVSLKLTRLNLGMDFGIEYINTPYYHNGPVWLRIGCSYNYFFDNIRTLIKPIRWY